MNKPIKNGNARVLLDDKLFYADGTVISYATKTLKEICKTNHEQYPNLCIAGKVRPLHQIMNELFNGPAPEGKSWSLHKDDNPHNNSANNLYWGNVFDNCADRLAAGNYRTSPMWYKQSLDAQILDMVNKGYTRQSIAKELNIATNTVTNKFKQMQGKTIAQYRAGLK